MSDRQVLAEQGAGLCAWGLGALGIASGNPLIAPIAVTAALVYDKFAATSKSRAKAAVKTALKALEDHADIPERGISAAAQLLKEQRRKIDIDLAKLKDAQQRNNFPDTLYDTIFAGVTVPQDDGVETALRLVIAAAFEELRHEPTFDTVFQQESLKAIEANVIDGFGRVDSKLDSQTALLKENSTVLQEIQRIRLRDEAEKASQATIHSLSYLTATIAQGGMDPKEIAELLYEMKAAGLKPTDLTKQIRLAGDQE